MSEFSKIYKKVNGTQQIKNYSKSHVLVFALAATALLGLKKKSLEIVRLAVDNRIYQRLKKKNASLINSFVAEHANLEEEHTHADKVWTIWLQGKENAPFIVQRCIDSMQENISGKEIVIITEDNYSDYVTFPDYIMEKYNKGIISKVHFADLLRIELLAKYGGTWLDGTVFVSEMLDKHAFYLDSDLFLFQTLKPGLDGHCSSISSWMITSYSNHHIITLTRALLHNYWKTHDYAVDYFILHDFFQMAIEAYPEEWSKVIPVSNEMPHVLLLRMFDQYNDDIWKAVKDITPFHKLTHKYDVSQSDQKNTYFDVLLKVNSKEKSSD